MCDLTAAYFQDAEKAREQLEAIRWPNGPFCPHCGSTKDPKPDKSNLTKRRSPLNSGLFSG